MTSDLYDHGARGDICPSTLEDRTRLIKEELRRLEDEHEQAIRKFHQKRTSLLQILNNEQAMTKRLPPETISLIFQHTSQATRIYPRAARIKSVLTLGHVSFQWRQIAWSTPQLWMDLDAKVKLHTIHRILQLLQLYLCNTRSLPFSLGLEFSDNVLFPEESLGALSELLKNSENATKIRSLFITYAPQQFILDLSQGIFPHLDDVHIYHPPTNSIRNVSLKGLPYLRKLSLSGIAPAIEYSWSTITDLTLTDLPIDLCIETFTQCNNLVEAHVFDPTKQRAGANELPWTSTDTITFPHLETLSWTFQSDPIHLALFQRIHAPSLDRLDSYSRGRPEEIIQHALADNFPAPSTLASLSFEFQTSWSPSFFQRVFSRTEHLPVLCLDNNKDCAINALSAILSTPGPEQKAYLPLLTRLSMSEPYASKALISYSSECGRMVFKLLERQWRNGIKHFRLDLSFINLDWGLDTRRAILSLVEEGFDLQIFNRNKKVDWLDQNKP